MSTKLQWLPFSKVRKMKLSHKKHGNLCYWEVRDGVVFHQRRKIRQADPESLEILSDPHSFVARDKNHVLHGWSLVKSIDRQTFEALGDFYYRDRQFAYAEHESSLSPLKGKDAKNFKALGCGYARDASYRYWWGKPLRKCESPLALKVIKAKDDLTMDYAMDKERVYCEAAALKDADLKTWQPLKQGFSKDKNTIFWMSDRLPRVDRDTWQQVRGPYSRDDNNVYVMNRRIPGADAATFRVTAQGIMSDKNGRIKK